jgi:hypothetical protein
VNDAEFLRWLPTDLPESVLRPGERARLTAIAERITLDERPISPEALVAVGFVQKKVGLGVYEHPSGLTAYSDDGKFFAWSHGLYDLKPQHMGDVNYILSRLARG